MPLGSLDSTANSSQEMEISPKKPKLGMEKTLVGKFPKTKQAQKSYVNLYKDTNIRVSDLVDASFSTMPYDSDLSSSSSIIFDSSLINQKS